jgi:hypothetical protein
MKILKLLFKVLAMLLPKPKVPKEIIGPTEEPPIQIVSMEALLTTSGKYLDRANSSELTPEVLEGAQAFLVKLNGFLAELGITQVQLSSGFRPSTVNAGIANASPRSMHQLARAVDIIDQSGFIDSLIQSRPDLLKKYGLWLEHPEATPGWSHIDDSDRRRDRDIRIFRP